MRLNKIILAMILVIVTVWAHEKALARAKKLQVLTKDQIDPSRILPPPPSDGTDAQQKELKEEANLVHTRSAERFQQAKWDNTNENPMAFAALISPDFDLAKLPQTQKLLSIVVNKAGIAASADKVYFVRKAPAVAANAADFKDRSCDMTDEPLKDRAGRSYPCGHVTMAYSVGTVLAYLIPEKSQDLLARASDYAYSREVCGDHYHSDIEAGHALGSVIGTLMINSDSVKSQIAAAKRELQSAHFAAV